MRNPTRHIQRLACLALVIPMGSLVACNHEGPIDTQTQELHEPSLSSQSVESEEPTRGKDTTRDTPHSSGSGVPILLSERCTGDIKRRERGIELIKDVEHLQQSLESVGYSLRNIEPIDFDKFVVVAAYAGEKTDCGYEVALSELPSSKEKEQPVIKAITRRTAETCRTHIAESSISYPFVFAIFPRLTNEQSYKLEEEEQNNCP